MLQNKHQLHFITHQILIEQYIILNSYTLNSSHQTQCLQFTSYTCLLYTSCLQEIKKSYIIVYSLFPEGLVSPRLLYPRPLTYKNSSAFTSSFLPEVQEDGRCNVTLSSTSVSYTHLDVYKRQVVAQFSIFVSFNSLL